MAARSTTSAKPTPAQTPAKKAAPKKAAPAPTPQKKELSTTCGKGHEFTPENTYILPSTGRRQCVTCRAEIRKAYRQARKAAAALTESKKAGAQATGTPATEAVQA